MIHDVKILETTLLSDNWYFLRKYRYGYTKSNGEVAEQTREVYDRGNGATILLYNVAQQTVILTRQFRIPTFVNGNETGMLIETCAGLLDKDDPENCIRREAEEETGYRIANPVKVFEAYMSPGSVSELVHFFIAPYEKEMKVNDGGGVDHEEENIEVLELPFTKALAMVASGEIRDGKTIMLLQHLQIKGLMAS
jgi:nudix-type nucleoside diphosphatase (YffH/AdpP family)